MVIPDAERLIIETAFLPATVKLMGEAFTDAWCSIEHEYTALDETEIEAVRLALAKAVVLFAGLGNSERGALKSKALGVMQRRTSQGNRAV